MHPLISFFEVGKITILEGQESKLVDLFSKFADEQYSKGRQAINDLNISKAYGFYKNGVRFDLFKNSVRQELHAIDIIAEILNCN